MPEMMLLPTTWDPSDEKATREIYGYIRERIEASQDRADPFKTSMLEDLRNFCSHAKDWGYNWQMFEPITQATVTSTEQEILSTVLSKERYVELRAVDGQDAVRTEKATQKLYRANRRARYKRHWCHWAMDAVRFGRGEMVTLACPYLDTLPSVKPVRDPHGFGLSLRTERATSATSEVGPAFVNVSIWNQLPYPYDGYPDLQDAPHHGWFIDLPLAEVRAMKFRPWAMWENTEKIEGNIGIDTSARSVQMNEYDYEFSSQRLSYAGWRVNDTEWDTPQCVRMCRVYFYCEAPPGQRGMRAWGAICENQVLFCRGNEYDDRLKPIDSLCWIPIDPTNLYWCFGVPGVIRSYQDRANIRLSMKYEQIQKALTPTKLAWPGFPVDVMSKLMAPTGSIIPVGQWKDVTGVTGGANPSMLTDLDANPARAVPMLDDVEEILSGVERATKQSAVSGGTADPNNVGAKAYASLALLSRNARKGTVFQLLYIENGGTEPQLAKTLSILQQTAPEIETVPLTGENETLAQAGHRDNFSLTREELSGRYEVEVVGASRTLEGPEMANVLLDIITRVAANSPKFRARLDDMDIGKHLVEWTVGQAVPWLLKSDEQFQRDQQVEPPPVHPAMLPKYRDLAAQDPGAAAEVLKRSGLQATVPSMTKRDEARVKVGAEREKTRREIIKQTIKPRTPRFLPRREQSVEEPANV